jgi:hypothetical protein
VDQGLWAKKHRPFSFLEVDDGMGHKTPMACACASPNAGRFQLVSVGIGLIHRPVVVTFGPLAVM